MAFGVANIISKNKKRIYALYVYIFCIIYLLNSSLCNGVLHPAVYSVVVEHKKHLEI